MVCLSVNRCHPVCEEHQLIVSQPCEVNPLFRYGCISGVLNFIRRKRPPVFELVRRVLVLQGLFPFSLAPVLSTKCVTEGR